MYHRALTNVGMVGNGFMVPNMSPTLFRRVEFMVASPNRRSEGISILDGRVIEYIQCFDMLQVCIVFFVYA
jgi:hypothetical protein